MTSQERNLLLALTEVALTQFTHTGSNYHLFARLRDARTAVVWQDTWNDDGRNTPPVHHLEGRA